MAQSEHKNKIIATASGESAFIFLEEKPNGALWTISLFCGTWGDTDLESSPTGVDGTWGDVRLSPTTVANFTANGGCRVPGNLYYRLNVNSYTADNPITAIAK